MRIFTLGKGSYGTQGEAAGICRVAERTFGEGGTGADVKLEHVVGGVERAFLARGARAVEPCGIHI